MKKLWEHDADWPAGEAFYLASEVGAALAEKDEELAESRGLARDLRLALENRNAELAAARAEIENLRSVGDGGYKL